MKYTDDETKEILVINRDVSKWTEDQNVERATKLAINAYLNGEISLDDLSCICNHYFGVLTKVGSQDQKLIGVLESGSDLAYFERKSGFSELKELLEFVRER